MPERQRVARFYLDDMTPVDPYGYRLFPDSWKTSAAFHKSARAYGQKNGWYFYRLGYIVWMAPVESTFDLQSTIYKVWRFI